MRKAICKSCGKEIVYESDFPGFIHNKFTYCDETCKESDTDDPKKYVDIEVKISSILSLCEEVVQLRKLMITSQMRLRSLQTTAATLYDPSLNDKSFILRKRSITSMNRKSYESIEKSSTRLQEIKSLLPEYMSSLQSEPLFYSLTSLQEVISISKLLVSLDCNTEEWKSIYDQINYECSSISKLQDFDS